MRLLIIILGIAIGSIALMGAQGYADYQNIGIAPTDSFQTIQVETSPWADTDTLVTADVYNQKIYFVSDGSIIFNVTNAYNSTHPKGP